MFQPKRKIWHLLTAGFSIFFFSLSVSIGSEIANFPNSAETSSLGIGVSSAQDSRASVLQIQEGIRAENSEKIPSLELPPKPPVSEGGELSSLNRIAKLEPALFEGLKIENVKRFGVDLFESTLPEVGELSPNMGVVPDSYRIGVGDEIEVHFWNQTQNEVFRSMVSPDGRIAFPLAGEISIMGIRYSELRESLLRQLKRFYTEIDLSFRILRLRNFPVYLTGEAVSPGMIIANALLSPIRLLMFKGGPGTRGSFRSLNLIRAGKVKYTIDLYELLLKGKVEAAIRFEPDDVLHIPLAKKRVALLGSVRRTGIFELKEEESLKDLLQFGGGFEGGADQSFLQVVRFDMQGRVSIKDLNPSTDEMISLGDGDVVIARILKQPIQNKVSVEGHVFHPGVFQWVPGLNIKELVQKAQGIPADTYLKRANLYRPLEEKTTFNLNKGLKVEAAEELIPVDLSMEFSGERATLVRAGDRLVIYSLPEVQMMPSVEVVGSVNQEGSFPLYGKSRVIDILFLAQLNESSYMLRGEIHRRTQGGLKILTFNLQEAIQGDREQNLVLENGDIISIFKDPDLRDQGRVYLKGLVQFPGVYPFQRGERLWDVLERAGGIHNSGYLKAAIFSRESVRKRQIKVRDDYIQQEQGRLETMKLEITQSETEEEERKRSLTGVEQVEGLVGKLSRVEVIGRIQLDFSGIHSLEDLKNSEVNILLEDGDQLDIPPTPSEITILGQVYSPGTLLYRSDQRVSDYLSLAGGVSEFAHAQRIYILKADGSAIPLSSARRPKRSLLYIKGVHKDSNNGLSRQVEPGDTIVVPARLRIRSDRFEKTLDAVYKTAVSVGALGGLFK